MVNRQHRGITSLDFEARVMQIRPEYGPKLGGIWGEEGVLPLFGYSDSNRLSALKRIKVTRQDKTWVWFLEGSRNLSRTYISPLTKSLACDEQRNQRCLLWWTIAWHFVAAGGFMWCMIVWCGAMRFHEALVRLIVIECACKLGHSGPECGGSFCSTDT
jgi:hypothetical protein